MKVRKNFKGNIKLNEGDHIELHHPVRVTYGRLSSISPDRHTFRATFEVYGYVSEFTKSKFQNFGGVVHETKKMKETLRKLDKEIMKELRREAKDGEDPT